MARGDPLPELVIEAGGERRGLWAGRDEAELRRIAAVLDDGPRRAAGGPPRES